jgi:LacI family transcriptional regulator
VLYLATENGDENSSEMPFGIRDVDGLVYLISYMVSKKFVAEVVKREIPIVMVDSRDTRFNIDSVLLDNIEGSKLAVRHLTGLGHRRIAFLNSSGGQSAPERLEGYREALREAGVPFDPRLVKKGSSKIADGRNMMRELLPLQPTAVYAFSDYLALGAITAAEDAGLTVPGDLSVASFGNEAQGYGECVGHALTTVDVDMQGMGAAAVELLMKRMSGSTEPSEVVRVKSNLLVGTTTAKPK